MCTLCEGSAVPTFEASPASEQSSRECRKLQGECKIELRQDAQPFALLCCNPVATKVKVELEHMKLMGVIS